MINFINKKVGSGEILPVGTELDIDKNAIIPNGWEEIEYDTGWVAIEIETSNCSIKPSSGSNTKTEYTPKIRRIGNTVFLRGTLRISIEKMSGGNMTLLSKKIPDKFLPTKSEITIPSQNVLQNMCNIFISSNVRTTENGKIMAYPDPDYFTPETGTTKVDANLNSSWTVDDLTTKRIRKITETQEPNKGEIYDNQERVIGTWLGKPLYRKVLSLTAQDFVGLSKDSKNRYLYPVSNMQINYLTRADVVLTYNADNKSGKKCFGSYAITNSLGGFDSSIHSIEDNNLVVAIGNTILNNLTSNVNIVLEYTKTTDLNNNQNSEYDEEL